MTTTHDGDVSTGLPCARITSVRFKGTFSVSKPEAHPESVNTPSEYRVTNITQPDDCGSSQAPREPAACYAGVAGDAGVATPSARCNRGLVVVYSRWIGLSGKTRDAAANAASAAS